MTKINREFLIPYLKNLCTLHMIESALESKKYALEQESSGCMNKITAVRRQKPVLEGEYSVGAQIFGVVVGLLILIVSVNVDHDFFGSFLCVVGLLFLFINGGILVYRKCSNAEINREYNDEYEYYKELVESTEEECRDKNLVITAQIDMIDAQIQEVKSVYENMYSANIIQKGYRDKYAVTYLYDWFYYSVSDDIDAAINAYVLEQIKERLDIIIEQNERKLINDAIIISNQYKSMEAQKLYHDDMVNKLNQLKMSVDDQNLYLRIIDSNTQAIAYFSAANYLKKL